MRNHFFNLFEINSNMCAWEKKNDDMVSHVPFITFFIKWVKKKICDNSSYFIYSNTSLHYFLKCIFLRAVFQRYIQLNKVHAAARGFCKAELDFENEMPVVCSKNHFLLLIYIKSEIEKLLYETPRSCSL